MQLEKANSNTGEAGLAGWISTNDVTLITLIVIVIVAFSLQVDLLEGQSENEALTSQNTELSADLTNSDSQLESTREQRDEVSAQLEEKQLELATLVQDLNLSNHRSDELSQQIAALQSSLDITRETVQNLTVEKTGLEKDKSTLTEERTALLLNRDDLLKKNRQEKATLQEQLEDLASTLAGKIAALEALKTESLRLNNAKEAEIKRLTGEANQLEEIVNSLTTKLNFASEAKTELQEEIASAKDLNEKYLAKLRRAATLFRGLKSDKAMLNNEVQGLSEKLSASEQRFDEQLQIEMVINRELVGLKGDLKRVAILFDASKSMTKKDEASTDDRWFEAQKIATTWLAHLNVDECVLIVFSSDVQTFPNDGEMALVRGEAGKTNRQLLMEHLKSLEPQGWTNTLAALKKAYEYPDLDTIILFSDGAPTNPRSGRFDSQVANTIYELCQQYPEIPVNSIGLGNYFDKEMSTFLRSIAKLTNGTFRGR